MATTSPSSSSYYGRWSLNTEEREDVLLHLHQQSQQQQQSQQSQQPSQPQQQLPSSQQQTHRITASELYGLANVEPNPHLYVHNVPKDATETELRDLFTTFGTVERIRLKVNQKVGPHALYAFVTFGTTAEAQLALTRLNGFDMRGRKLRIEFQRNSRGRSVEQTYNNSNSSNNNMVIIPVPPVPPSPPSGIQIPPKQAQPTVFQQSAVPAVREAMYKRPRLPEDQRSGGPWAKRPTLRSNPRPWGGGGSELMVLRVSLLDALQKVKPHIYPSHQQQLSEGISQTVENSATAAAHAAAQPSVYLPQDVGQSQQPTGLTQPAEQQQSIVIQIPPPSPRSIIGNLARNSKRRVPVCLHPIDPPLEDLLPEYGALLNISHRSTTEDIQRKSVVGWCLLTGAADPSMPAEAIVKLVHDHVSYLVQKQRAGVVALPADKSSMYLIPPGVPLFQKYISEIPPHLLQSCQIFPDFPTCMIAVFCVGGSNTVDNNNGNTNNYNKNNNNNSSENKTSEPQVTEATAHDDEEEDVEPGELEDPEPGEVLGDDKN